MPKHLTIPQVNNAKIMPENMEIKFILFISFERIFEPHF